MRKRTGRFIITAISGAVVFFGISILATAIPIRDFKGVAVGISVVAIGFFIFSSGTKGA